MGKYWLPPDSSGHGAPIDSMMVVIHWFMLLLFVGWGIFFVYCLFRFRAGANPRAQYEPVKGTVSKFIEIGVVIFEAVLLVGFSMPVWADWKDKPPSEDQALQVRIVAKQFEWYAHYAGPDGKWGRRLPEKAVGGSPAEMIGLDTDDPAAKDDKIFPILHFPVGKDVILKITSQDVIHSFGSMALRLKQDAIPGMMIPIWFKATKAGVYEVACSQLCGLSHYKMRMQLYCDTPEDYAKWVAQNWPK